MIIGRLPRAGPRPKVRLRAIDQGDLVETLEFHANSIRSTAAALGVQPGTLSGELRARGLSIKPDWWLGRLAKVSTEELRAKMDEHGRNATAVAKLYGVHVNLMYVELKRRGIPRLTPAEAMRRKARPWSHADLHRLYVVEGKSTPQIGRIYGVGHRAVLNWLVECEIPRRPNHGPPMERVGGKFRRRAPCATASPASTASSTSASPTGRS